jgi:hypothetical protein
MKQVAYLLISLTFWSQFDDALLTPASALQSAPLPSDDDDEFLPPQRQEREEPFAARRQPQPVSVKPYAADFSTVERGVPSEWNLTTPFAPPPLYAFMSLQI